MASNCWNRGWAIACAVMGCAAVGFVLALPADNPEQGDVPARGRLDYPLASAEPAIDDRVITRLLEREGQRLAEAGSARTVEDLANEMNARGVSLMPRPDVTEPMSAEALYKARCGGVLVLGEIYKCGSCPNWHTGASGTAFVISEGGVCVTNYHMFEERDEEVYVFAYTHDGGVYAVDTMFAASKADDVAIFGLGTGRRNGEDVAPGATVFNVVPVRPDAPVGTEVALISHPEGDHYMLTTGTIARRSMRRSGINADSPGRPTPTLAVTCEYAVGSSGGPVMDMNGRAVGMVVSTHTIFAGEGRRREPQMVVRNCIPAERILAVLNGEVATGRAGKTADEDKDAEEPDEMDAEEDADADTPQP